MLGIRNQIRNGTAEVRVRRSVHSVVLRPLFFDSLSREGLCLWELEEKLVHSDELEAETPLAA